MGGIIISYYLRYGNSPLNSAIEDWKGSFNFKNIILCATPFKGTLIALDELLNGAKLGLNSTLFSKDSVQTFPVAYQLIPELVNDYLFDEKNNPIDALNADSGKIEG